MARVTISSKKSKKDFKIEETDLWQRHFVPVMKTGLRWCLIVLLRWLNTVLRAVSGNSRDDECFKLDKQTWRRKSNGAQKTISQNLLIKIL